MDGGEWRGLWGPGEGVACVKVMRSYHPPQLIMAMQEEVSEGNHIFEFLEE